jgi:hypothetical protein
MSWIAILLLVVVFLPIIIWLFKWFLGFLGLIIGIVGIISLFSGNIIGGIVLLIIAYICSKFTHDGPVDL